MDYKRYSLCNNQITRIMSTRILFPLKQCLKLLHFIQLFIIPIVKCFIHGIYLTLCKST